MSQAKDKQPKRAGRASPDMAQEESSAGEPLGAYLARLKGRSCVLPFQMVRELTGASLPGAATSAEWWMDVEGWPASPVAAACQSTGWRLDSVTESARLVRLVRFERDVRAAREAERIRPPRAGPRSGD